MECDVSQFSTQLTTFRENHHQARGHSSTKKMEALGTSEILAHVCDTTQCHTSEDYCGVVLIVKGSFPTLQKTDNGLQTPH